MSTFEDLKISKYVLKAIEEQGFTEPITQHLTNQNLKNHIARVKRLLKILINHSDLFYKLNQIILLANITRNPKKSSRIHPKYYQLHF